MLKKSGVVVILLLIIISFTTGSVSTAVEPVNDSGMAEYHKGMFMVYGDNFPADLPPPPYFDELPSGYPESIANDGVQTYVVLDFFNFGQCEMKNGTWSRGEIASHPPGFMVKHDGEGNFDYIEGRMSVSAGGASAVEAFPVKFMKHGFGNGTMKPFMDSYRANMAVRLNGSEATSFTFNSEILILNQSLSSDIDSLQDSLYDSRISAGETVWHQAQVSEPTTAFNFDLQWKDTATSLRLVVYTPDGHVLGPYYDDSDGKTDGRINMEVDNSAGVATGTWSFKVTDTGVTGKDEYYLKTW